MKKLGLFATLAAGSFLAIACSHNEPAQQAAPSYTPTAQTPGGQNEMQPVSGSEKTGQQPGTGTMSTPTGSTTVQPPAANPNPTYPSGANTSGTYQPNTGSTTGTTPGATTPNTGTTTTPIDTAAGKGDAGTKGAADGGVAPKK